MGIQNLAVVQPTRTLDELFTEARGLGLVILHTHDDATYSVTIKFPTIANVELKAQSGFGHKSPHAAFQFAIDRAHEIRKAFR